MVLLDDAPGGFDDLAAFGIDVLAPPVEVNALMRVLWPED